MPELLPRPTRYSARDGHYTITPESGVRAPEPIAALVRELLGPATGFGFPQGDPGLSFTLVDDPSLGAEGYRLSVTPDGVGAYGTEAGLRWAVQTLRQLLPGAVYAGEVQGDARWEVPCVDIVDVPHYAWRGALLDVARWCHPVPFLHRFVDLM